jgi:ribonuclease-3
LANSFESILGAIYLDGGLDAAKNFLLPFVEQEVDATLAGDSTTNYKSELQQFSQKEFGLPPNYLSLSDRGPDHDKTFEVAAQVDGTAYSAAWGKNKKEAEQRAAANALAEINGDEAPFANGSHSDCD